MPRLATRTKLAIARILRVFAGAWVRVWGGDIHNVRCKRGGVEWVLDLDEGVQLALFLSVYERSTTKALVRLVTPDAVVIDIGANVGAQALPVAARLSGRGRLIAVEPTETAMRRLRANCTLNPALASRLTLIHRALVAPGQSAASTYFASWPLSGGADAHPVHRGAPEPSSGVASTLDDLITELEITRVDLIKLDVDGNELSVLRGASRVLARDRPAVVFELCPYLLEERGEPPTALTAFFRALGYTLFDERTLEPYSVDDETLLRGIPSGGGINIVAAIAPLRLRG